MFPSIFNHVNMCQLFKPMGERQAASPTSSVVQKVAALFLELYLYCFQQESTPLL